MISIYLVMIILKNINIVTEDNFGNVLTLGAGDSLEIMIKLDYVDQLAVTNQYISEVPMRL